MTETLPVSEGRIPFGGAETWYRIVGEGERPGALPLLLLHGGPGGTHDYLEPMAELARGGRRVIFYDQLGCGNSPHPSDPDKWTVQLFLDEVAAVRDALGLDRIHLLGQSWGGMLAMEYVLTRADRHCQPGHLRLAVEHAAVGDRGQPAADAAAARGAGDAARARAGWDDRERGVPGRLRRLLRPPRLPRAAVSGLRAARRSTRCRTRCT